MARKRFAAAAATALVGSALAVGAMPATASAGTTGQSGDERKTVVLRTQLNELNNSGVSGRGMVHVKGNHLDVKFAAFGLLRNAPHAAHIHFGEQARHECPTLADDTNGDGRLSTLEGAPAYGPVRVSLTKGGDTSPASALAIDRFSTAPKGSIRYHRHDIKTSSEVAKAIRNGEGVLVVHGVDYNHNGMYDFSAGKSDLDPKFPAEATDPAACGVLR